ncbi:MAG: hypothetical protein E7568_00105 [Ruminococcaceae bacterium]|nr:hypothetical protein [Oscillospiraceae bacterium]
MKKYISIILCMCMLLSLVVFPVNAIETTYAGDTYYKFTFGSGGTAYGQYVSGQTATHKGVTYYPLIDQIPGSTTASVTAITDKNTQQPVNTLRVEGSNGSRWKMVPLKSDGTPFEVAPNSSYTVKIKMFVEDKASSSQFFMGLAAYKTNGSTSHDSRTTSQGWFNGSFVTSQVVHSPFLSGTVLSGAQAHYTDFDSSRTAQYIEKEVTIATGNNAVYDSQNNTYKFVFDLIGSENTVENTNYFFLSGYGKEFSVENDGTYADTVHIVEIEIQKNPASVTFVNGGSSSSKVFVSGSNIEYPTLTANRNGDYVWSLSNEEYIPAPAKMPLESITVYAMQRNIIGFENYKYCDYTDISNRIEVSSEKAYIGDKSLRYQNVEYKLSEEVTGGKPFSFDGSYYKYFYTYNESTGQYAIVPEGTAPTWQSGKYYIKRPADALEHSIELWKLESNKNYRVSFKYYFDESSQCSLKLKPFSSASSNIWGTTVFYGDGNITLNKPETAGWQEGELYFSTGNLSSATEYLYLQLVNAANNDTTPITVYFDEFKLEEKVPNQVDDPNVEYGSDLISYCSFENTSTTSPYGFVDYVNNYAIARVDKHYIENGKKIMGEWSLNGRYGFDSTNISVSNSGYESTRSLEFKQANANSGNSVAYKIADIGNGFILEDKTTYRLSFYYRADGVSDKDLTFSFVNAMDKDRVATINASNTLTIASADVKSGWTFVTVDLTTDFDKIGGNISGEAYCIPAIVVNANINDTVRTVHMDNFAICKPLSNSMVSVLNDDASQKVGAQALRFYFSYNADADGKLLLSGNTYELSARGILISISGSGEELVRENSKIYKAEKTEKLDEYWSYNSGALTFSAYIKNFDTTDSRKLEVRGYLVLSDGSILYSPISEYSLDDVKGYYDITASSTYYSLTDNNVISKVGFEGANEKTSNGYTFDWNGSALVVTAKTAGKMKVYLSGSVEGRNFTLYIDGELVSDKLKPVYESGKYTVTFDVGNYPTVKEIRFIRQQEAANGTAEIHGFDMCGQLMKTEDKDILIEYIGDSITSGIGVHSIHHEHSGTAVNDGTNSYAFLSAQYLGVNYRIRSREGIALNQGYAYLGVNKPGANWISTYNYENYWRNQTDNTYLESRAADIVVIYLGTNDVLSGGLSSFNNDSIHSFINIVKEHNPNAKIVWISGGMKTEYRPNLEMALNSLGGESAGYYICDMPAEFAYKDASGNYVNTGYHGHPGAEQQKVMAHTLIDFLKAKNLVD